uniref:RING-type E3 ubiquitin transferase n=1 Tax=Brassica oleracea var. oleracea TaxID=109376 RepID=A0A0D3DBW3_BRAOL
MGSIDTFILALFRLSLGPNLFFPASIVSPPPPPRLFHFIFSPPPPSSNAIDPTPLLLSGDENEGSNSNRGGEQQRSSSVRRPGLREAARLLSRASSGGRRAMREPSMVVREAAAEQLEERQSDWAYSKPIVVLDIVWNLAFVSVAGAILVMARNEHPIMPLRVWLLGRNRVTNNRTPRSRSSSSSSSMEEDALGSRRNSHEEIGSWGMRCSVCCIWFVLVEYKRRNRVTNNRTPRSRSSSSSSSMEEDALAFKTHVTRTVAIQLTELTSLVQTTILIFGGSS